MKGTINSEGCMGSSNDGSSGYDDFGQPVKLDHYKSNGTQTVNSKINGGHGDDGFGNVPSKPVLEGDAKILATAYKSFSKNGMTHDETVKLAKIDEVLTDASIQLVKNGGAIITDNKGKSTFIRE